MAGLNKLKVRKVIAKKIPGRITDGYEASVLLRQPVLGRNMSRRFAEGLRTCRARDAAVPAGLETYIPRDRKSLENYMKLRGMWRAR